MAIKIAEGLLYLTRKEWGADTSIPRLGISVPRSERTEAIIHHTVIVDTDATKNLWTNMVEVKAKMRQLQVIRPDLGTDVPYNFVMFLMENGTVIVCEGRGLDRRGAHTKYHNRTGMATALQGNFMLVTHQGLSRFVPLISRWWGWVRYDMKMVNLGSKHPAGRIAFGHIDLSATACPGTNLYDIIPQLTFQKKEEDMPLNTADKTWIRSTIASEAKKAAVAALVDTAKSVTEVRNSLRGGDLPGIWVKAKGQGTIYYVEYVGGVLMRHHARNPQSYIGVGGNWKVIEVTPEQLELMPRGPGLPDLKIT